MNPARARVSVIIPARDAATTIGRTLDSLAGQTRTPDEIIVADNGSRDSTREIVAAAAANYPTLAIRIVDAGSDRRGPGPVRNAGAAAATGDTLAFIDSDCVATDRWLERILEPFPLGADAVAGTVEGHAPATSAAILQALLAPPPGGSAPAPLPENGALVTNSFAIRRETFLVSGGFDERLRWLEDAAYALALRRGGHALFLAPEARVSHDVPGDTRGMLRRAWKYGLQEGSFLRLYHPRRAAVSVTRRVQFHTDASPVRVSVLASPDKVLVTALALGALWLPLALSALVPLAYYLLDLRRRAVRARIPLPLARAVSVLVLDFLYHAVLSAGRLAGSPRGRTLCL